MDDRDERYRLPEVLWAPSNTTPEDWRKARLQKLLTDITDQDDDELRATTPDDVLEMLGFDPRSMDD